MLWDTHLLRYANRNDQITPENSFQSPNDTHSPPPKDPIFLFSTPSDDDHFFDSNDSPFLYAATDDNFQDDSVENILMDIESESDSEINAIPTNNTPDLNGNLSASTSTGSKSIFVRLDIFHAMLRISRTLKKSHGAFKIFMARFRDAMFLVNTKDVELICEALKKKGMSDEEVKTKIDEDWVFFIRYCRRLVPSSEILLKRFDRVCNAFADVKDAKTDEPFFRSNTRKVVNNIREHIQKGCLSDVTGVPLYVAIGKDEKTGMTKYRCIRGTNGTEGYHKHIRELLSRNCGSPKLVHQELMEFNYRWNVKMAIKNRGLSEIVGGFFHQYLLEEINTMTSAWSTNLPYPAWLSIDDFEDTGERTGFQVSNFPGQASTHSIEDINLTELSEEISTSVLDPILLPSLTPSAKYFARLQQFKIPALPVRTADEKSKFYNEWAKYLCNKTGNQRSNSAMDFDQWALDWNNEVERMEAGLVGGLLFRKTAGHLSAFYRRWKEKINSNNTLRSHVKTNLVLRRDLRAGNPTADFPVLEPWTNPIPRISIDDDLHAAIDSTIEPLSETLREVCTYLFDNPCIKSHLI